ncbi:MAG: penicillin acylase family protein, partial [Ignavibacteria bacterium]|nr:penicillin acylase family protein [Ignavibacteria bacterium]
MFKSTGGRLLVNLAGMLIVLIAILLTLYFLFNKLTEKSFYDESGTVKLEGLKSQVEIVRDSYGVPNITSSNEEDLYFALGYTHAQDRLWQMDFVRRVAEGRTAEIFGRETVGFDKLFRTIGINRYAYSLYPGISEKSKSILKNYSNGVNAFIRKNNKKLPLEFDILNYKPEEWKPEHSLMVVRMMGWELNLSWMTEFTFSEILKRFGAEKSKDFFPDYPEDAPYAVKQDKSDNPSTKKEFSGIDVNSLEKRYRSITELGSGFYETVTGYREFFKMTGTHIGSNAWAVNGIKTEGKKPILANDPHLALLVPARWYEVVMRNTSDNSMVCGFSIPGAPGIAIGSNGKISWGMTNLMNDDSDFLILNRDSADYSRYIYKNVSYPIDSLEEYIKIKDIKDELPFYIHVTKSGPVISELDKTGFISDSKFKVPKNEIMTFKWTGFELSDEILAFYDVYHSKNWGEFRNSLRNFGLPASNFVYADAEGNIGYQAAGKIPVRKVTGETEQAVPQYGDIEWTGFVPFDELPVSYNPPDNFVASANNKPQKDYKYYISNLYEEPYRAMRIEEVLKSKNNITAQEFKLLQNDV